MARNNMGPGFVWFEGIKISLDFSNTPRQRIPINLWLETNDIGSLDVALELLDPTIGGASTPYAYLRTTPILTDENALMMDCDKSAVLTNATDFVTLSAIAGQGPYLVSSRTRQPSAFTFVEFVLESGSGGQTFTATVRAWAVPRGTP